MAGYGRDYGRDFGGGARRYGGDFRGRAGGYGGDYRGGGRGSAGAYFYDDEIMRPRPHGYDASTFGQRDPYGMRPRAYGNPRGWNNGPQYGRGSWRYDPMVDGTTDESHDLTTGFSPYSAQGPYGWAGSPWPRPQMADPGRDIQPRRVRGYDRYW
jgi:hypothetical protein